jgi:hypothetical protein
MNKNHWLACTNIVQRNCDVADLNFSHTPDRGAAARSHVLAAVDVDFGAIDVG